MLNSGPAPCRWSTCGCSPQSVVNAKGEEARGQGGTRPNRLDSYGSWNRRPVVGSIDESGEHSAIIEMKGLPRQSVRDSLLWPEMNKPRLSAIHNSGSRFRGRPLLRLRALRPASVDSAERVVTSRPPLAAVSGPRPTKVYFPGPWRRRVRLTSNTWPALLPTGAVSVRFRFAKFDFFHEFWKGSV